MVTPDSSSQITSFNACLDDLIGVLKLPAVWAGHPAEAVVNKVLETLLALLRQNFADDELVRSRINDLISLLPDQQALTRLEDEQRANPIAPDSSRKLERVAQSRRRSGKAHEHDTRKHHRRVCRARSRPVLHVRQCRSRAHAWPEPSRVARAQPGGDVPRNGWPYFPAGIPACRRRKYAGGIGELLPTHGSMVRNECLPSRDGGLAIYFQDLSEKKAAEAASARKNQEWQRARDTLQQELAAQSEDVLDLTRQFIASKHALLALKDELAADLTAMTRLHELSSRLSANSELRPLLDEVLEATMTLLNADCGTVQLSDGKSRELELVAQRGFAADLLDEFRRVEERSVSSCGRTLQRRERVIIEDVQTDPHFERLRPFAEAAGVRAAQSTPLFSRSGELLGMITTYYRRVRLPLERELRFLDLYAREAAEMVERKRIEDALRRSEAYLAKAQRLSHTGSWVWNVSTRDLYWSTEHFQIFGLDPETTTPGTRCSFRWCIPTIVHACGKFSRAQSAKKTLLTAHTGSFARMERSRTSTAWRIRLPTLPAMTSNT